MSNQMNSDSILSNLKLNVSVKPQEKLKVQRMIIEPSNLRVLDSITRNDSSKTIEVIEESEGDIQSKQSITIQKIKKHHSYPLKPIVPIEARSIPYVAFTNEIDLPEKPLKKSNPDWMVGIIILALIIFASVKLIFSKYLTQLIHATINYSTASRLFREKNFNLLHGSFRLDILFYLIFSLFLYQSFKMRPLEGISSSIIVYLIILTSVCGYFLLKNLVYRLIGIMTENRQETQEYLFNINIYNRILGLVLLPVTVIIAFYPLHNVKQISVAGIIIITGFYLLVLIRGGKILLKKHFSILYLILYLCTLEFLPLLLIYKLMLI